ncbi:MAG: galactokinase [Bryobacterales bacterium]|nr:galactokinase [Bryobacterales bacterium]
MATHSANLSERFQQAWGSQPRLFQAPGRVNLIGEHTDYNDGFVLPAAIQLQTRIAAGPAPGRQLFVKSATYPDDAVFDLDDTNPLPRKHWSDYVRGVALFLEREGLTLKGARLLIESDIPPGAGLSSSAALEVATAWALLSDSGLHMELSKIAQVCHRAENEFVGVRSGIMDQFASCYGRRDHALLLDCRSLEMRYVPVPHNAAMMVCNTMVRHELGSSEYNSRRRQCEQGMAVLSRFLPDIRALRDVSAAQLARFSAELDPLIHRRCRHVIEENRRVLTGAQALEHCDLVSFGALMMESHQSLRLDYEVSSPELDLMCELALGVEGVYGARMVGGGFGGCALALADQSAIETFVPTVMEEYRRRTGIACEIYQCSAADGAGPIGG